VEVFDPASTRVSNSDDLVFPFITPRHGPRRKHSLSIVEKACLLIRYLALDVLLRGYASAGMCLPSRCLVMGLYVTILIRLISLHTFTFVSPFSYGTISDVTVLRSFRK
jgi:hypothetical protein